MSVSVYRVEGMSCEHCKRAVESALLDLPGVVAVSADVNLGVVTVETSGTVTVDMIQSAVSEAGYKFLA